MEGYELIAIYEGFTIEEAKLTYAARQRLPKSAFCGPDRTYPAHDAKHVRAGLQRLSQFWRKLSPAIRKRIYNCLKRRAKKFGVDVDVEKFKKVEETVLQDATPVIEWALRNVKK